ncbi:TadE family type IV pilus minor pilin [Micromonospora sp. NPDC050187]|uniref:TadE family type IV pilus minor pilin n=1 Tax=Micromonospora sp. NPDC050187 TaxID=3364277 RepID=UPI0037ADFEB6
MTGRRRAGRARAPHVATSPTAATGGSVAEAAADGGQGAVVAEGAAGDDRGSFTAELAAGLPALMLLLLAGLTVVSAATTKATCLDAAREAALAASRGESGRTAGDRVAPAGADISIEVDQDRVTVTVRAPVRTLGANLPRITVAATAVAAVEPGTPFPAS